MIAPPYSEGRYSSTDRQELIAGLNGRGVSENIRRSNGGGEYLRGGPRCSALLRLPRRSLWSYGQTAHGCAGAPHIPACLQRLEAPVPAIGQLADYKRFVDPPPNHLAVLLPSRPRSDLEALLTSENIQVIWPAGEGFSDQGCRRITACSR